MRNKICKIHKKELTPAKPEWFIVPIYHKGLECTDCVDNLDFWLPLLCFLMVIPLSIYYAIFPIVEGTLIRYGLLILGLILLLFHLTDESSLRVLKRLLIKSQTQAKS